MLLVLRWMEGRPMPDLSPRLWTVVAVMALFMLQDAVRLWLGWRSANGTARLTASPEGLAFENAPGSPKTGQCGRSEVGAMKVMLIKFGAMRRRVYALKIMVRGDRRWITLALSTDMEALTRLRSEMAWAMEIERRPEAAKASGQTADVQQTG